MVHNDMGDGWLWVTSQSTGLSGIVYHELVQELVSLTHYVLVQMRPFIARFIIANIL